MKYGLIGEHLGHSFSKIIHSMIADYDYELCELCPSELDDFMTKREFNAINVTIPYKQSVIPYLDFMSEQAKEIGAVNTIVNKDGKLYGYNTDYFGMRELIKHIGLDIEGRKVLILGGGGTSKTAFAVAKGLMAGEVYKLSRGEKGGCITYAEAYERHADAEIIINTTPSGMFPNIEDCPIDINRFDKLRMVVDAVYNPLRTKLVKSAQEKGISAEGGLYMLVSQAVSACDIFLDKKLDEGVTERVYNKILADRENIVLVGMPACGKSTIGKLVAEKTGREFFDLDSEIVAYTGRQIPEIFATDGESKFRDIESEVLSKKLASLNRAVIATGGGAILRSENVEKLKMNGKLYFLNRPLCQLLPTPDRPTASSKEAIEARYKERLPIYKKVSDIELLTDGIAENTANEIIKKHFSED